MCKQKTNPMRREIINIHRRILYGAVYGRSQQRCQQLFRRRLCDVSFELAGVFVYICGVIGDPFTLAFCVVMVWSGSFVAVCTGLVALLLPRMLVRREVQRRAIAKNSPFLLRGFFVAGPCRKGNRLGREDGREFDQLFPVGLFWIVKCLYARARTGDRCCAYFRVSSACVCL